MFPLPHQRDTRDQGMTLIEVLVAIFLLALVGTIVSGIVIAAMKLTSRTQSGVEGQEQLNDAVSRITRDVAAADPIIYTSTATGWAKNTPAADELWTQSVTNGKCVRTRYYVDTSTTPKTLDVDTRTYSTSSCPDPRLPDTNGTLTTKTLISDLKTTNDSGQDTKVFTYYTRDNTEITAPVNRADIAKIARVKIDVGSNVRDRAKGVRLATSVAPRSMDNPLVTNSVPPPSCVEANLRVASNGLVPSSPVVQWSATANATTFTLGRTTVVPASGLVTTGTNPYTYTDTAMRGRWGSTITYTLDISGPGGLVQCTYNYLPPSPPVPSAPQVSGTVTPDTSAGGVAVATPTANLSWSAVASADSYTIYRRPIDPNATPYNPTGTGTWEGPITTTTSLSWSQGLAFDAAYEYKVVANDTDFIPNLTSGDSNIVKELMHPEASTLTGAPLTYQQNRVTWTAAPSSTVDGYGLYRRLQGTGTWTLLQSFTGAGGGTYTDMTAGLGTTYEYMISAYNDGPRGGTYSGTYTQRNARYYGPLSNIVTILQYPAIPTTQAYGTYEKANAFSPYTYYNPDGTDSVTWNTVPTATSYKVMEFNDDGASAPVNTFTGLTGTGMFRAGYIGGSRQFFMAIACNATGCSENEPNTALRPAATDDAYQRPATPLTFVATSPTLNSNDVSVNFLQNGDTGESTDKFCSVAGSGCTYTILKSGSGVVATPTNGSTYGTYNYNGDEGNYSNDWGKTYQWTEISCNPGGCSNESANSNSLHYPGPFKFQYGSTWSEKDHHQYWEGNNHNDFTRTTSGTGYPALFTTGWQDSTGVKTFNGYDVSISTLANDPVNSGLLWSNTQTNSYLNQGQGPQLTPGASYTFKAVANAPNGLTRSDTATVQVPPIMPDFFESAKSCKDSITDGTAGAYKGWKMVYEFRRDGGVNRGSGTRYNTYVDNLLVTEVAGKKANATYTNWDSGADWANTAQATGGDKLGTPTQWQNAAAGDYWYHNGSTTQTAGMSAVLVVVAGNQSDDGYYIKSAEGGMGFARVRPQVNKTGNHATDYGDWLGEGMGDVEYSGTGGQDCPNTYSSWTVKPDSISRWFLRSLPSANGGIDPNLAAGAKWNYFSGALN